MTDIKRLEDLLKLARQKGFGEAQHKAVTENLVIYIDSGDHNEPEERSYFEFKYKDLSISHTSIGTLQIDAKMDNFSDINFNEWANGVERELNQFVDTDVITINGKKYIPLKEEVVSADNIPF